MIFSFLMPWALLVGVIPHAHSLSSPTQVKVGSAMPARTVLETKFLLSDYGWVLEPRKLSKRDQLALLLTNRLDGGQ